MQRDPAYWDTPEGLRELAAGYCYDNHAPGDLGFCYPHDAVWTRETLNAQQLANVFDSAANALAWITQEIESSEAEGYSRGWRELLTQTIREEVIVLIREGQAFVWDGFHRVAASLATGRDVLAIVGRPTQT